MYKKKHVGIALSSLAERHLPPGSAFTHTSRVATTSPIFLKARSLASLAHLGHLHKHRIPAEQTRQDVVHQVAKRVVPRRNDPQHPQRHVLNVRSLVEHHHVDLPVRLFQRLFAASVEPGDLLAGG